GPVQSQISSVTTVKVLAVSLTPATLALNMAPPGGYTSGGYASTASIAARVDFSALVSISGVAWAVATSSAATSSVVTVSQGGLVTAGSKGTATLKATAIDDARVSATAGVVVQDKGLFDFTVQ
ncbi:MAG: hypothetical protein FJZ00_06670, partial [Candidatus Sericytochromatia bacterium]|nr:hypothetical protein [Candidatus Tanganyikabacteria bacterium]